MSEDVESWNGMPIVGYHPTSNGKGTGARNPRVLAEQTLGWVYESVYDKGHKAELWFDEELTKNFDKRMAGERGATYKPIHPRLEKGEPIEVSTGLKIRKRKDEQGTHNGVSYKASVESYRPDHLAVLPDIKGACSIKDGCGIFNEGGDSSTLLDRWIAGLKRYLTLNGAWNGSEDNLNPQPINWDVLTPEEVWNVFNPRSQNTGRFKPMGFGTGKGEAFEAAQRGFMVLTDEDKARGKQAYAELQETGNNPASWVADEAKWEKAKGAAEKGGYSGDTYWAVVSHIYRQMGGKTKEPETKNEAEKDEVPTTSNDSGDQTMATKAQNVQLLITNCDCWKEEGSDKILNSMTDTRIEKLIKNWETVKAGREAVKRLKESEPVLNAVSKGFKDGNNTFVFNSEAGTFVKNEKAPTEIETECVVNAFPPKKCPKCDASMKDGKCEKCGYTMNTMQNQTPKRKSLKEYKSQMEQECPEALEILNAAEDIQTKAKAELVRKLVANVEDPEKRQKKGESLMKKRFSELKELEELIPVKQVRNRRDPEDDDDDGDDKIDFTGNAGGSVSNRGKRPILPLPDNDWSWRADQLSAERKQQPA